MAAPRFPVRNRDILTGRPYWVQKKSAYRDLHIAEGGPEDLSRGCRDPREDGG